MVHDHEPTQRWARLLALVGTLAALDARAEELTDFDCLIVPHTVAEVSTREGGILETLLVDRGDLVSAGQPVAHLNRDVELASVELSRAAAERSAEIDELEASLAYAVREHRRVARLAARKAVSSTEVDKAVTAETLARARLEQAQERKMMAGLELLRARKVLESRTVRSPVDGVVMALMMAPGEAAENRPVVKIAKLDPLYVEVIVPIEAFGRIRPGMRAEVTPRYPGASPRTATVSVVDRVVDAASDTISVQLVLENPALDIPGGVRCEIRIQVDD